MNEQQIKELFSDEAFVASILELETPEEVQACLAEKGLDLTLEEITTIQKSLENNNGELSEDELENVAGGSVTAIVCGLIIGGAVLAGGVNIGNAISNWVRRRW